MVTKKFGTSVDDERYRQSRFALKHSSLIRGKFSLVAEENFAVTTYYDTVQDVLDDITRDAKDRYDRLDEETKRKIHERLNSRLTDKGIIFSENAVLSALQKSSPSSSINP